MGDPGRVRPQDRRDAVTTLLSAAADARALEVLLQEAQGELSPELESWMDEVEKTVAGKVDAYHYILSRLEANEDHLRIEASALEAAARSIAKVRENMKARIKMAMLTMDTDEIKGSAWRFKLSPAQPRLVVDDEGKIPKDYMVVSYSPDKDKLKAAIKSGAAIEGVHIETTDALRTYPNKSGAKA
mgnify:CR=1 FL=1